MVTTQRERSAWEAPRSLFATMSVFPVVAALSLRHVEQLDHPFQRVRNVPCQRIGNPALQAHLARLQVKHRPGCGSG